MTSAPSDHDLRHVYASRSASGTGPAISRVERALLVDTFRAVGSSAPTLSGDWDAYHLAAHLVLREQDPVGSVRAAVPRLGDPAVEALVARSAFEHLVEQIRTGPPQLSIFRIPGSDSRFNALEYFIHHEDVRRAQPAWTRRDLPTWAQTQIWRPIRILAKAFTRHAPVPLLLERSDTGETSVARKGDRPVVVCGLPSELALYVYGRATVADVAFDGDADAVERLRGARSF